MESKYFKCKYGIWFYGHSKLPHRTKNDSLTHIHPKISKYYLNTNILEKYNKQKEKNPNKRFVKQKR